MKTDDLADNAVTSAKIADGTIQEEDIADGVIPSGGEIQLNVHRVEGEVVFIPPKLLNTAKVDCPSGEILTGGGVEGTNSVRITTSFPTDANTWSAIGFNDGDTDAAIQAYALCIDPTITIP